MFNKKSLFIFGYIVGVFVAMLTLKKNSKEIKKEIIESNKSSLEVIFDNFVELHRDIYNTFYNKVMTEENKEFFESKKLQAQEMLNEYKEKGYEILKDYKGKGQEFIKEGLEELDNFYKEKILILEEKLKDKNSYDILEEIKKEFKTIIQDFKDYLQKKN